MSLLYSCVVGGQALQEQGGVLVTCSLCYQLGSALSCMICFTLPTLRMIGPCCAHYQLCAVHTGCWVGTAALPVNFKPVCLLEGEIMLCFIACLIACRSVWVSDPDLYGSQTSCTTWCKACKVMVCPCFADQHARHGVCHNVLRQQIDHTPFHKRVVVDHAGVPQ